MGEFSFTHLLLIAIIFLVFFGPSRLPNLGKSLGQAIRGFKQGLNEIDAEVKPVNDTNPQQLQNGQNQQQVGQAQQTQKEKQNT